MYGTVYIHMGLRELESYLCFFGKNNIYKYRFQWFQCHLQEILLSPSLCPTSPSAERLPPERTRTGFRDAGSIFLLVGSFGYGWFSNSYPLTDPDPVDYAPACRSYRRRALPHPLVPSTLVPTEPQSAVHCSAHASSRPNFGKFGCNLQLVPTKKSGKNTRAYKPTISSPTDEK